MLKTYYKELKIIFFTMLVFINVDLVCINFRIFFEEVMIILCLFIGYQPHICPKNPILVIKLLFKKLTISIF